LAFPLRKAPQKILACLGIERYELLLVFVVELGIRKILLAFMRTTLLRHDERGGRSRRADSNIEKRCMVEDKAMADETRQPGPVAF
jgi:16S rRNA U1498 N3-methylase RsmE